MLVNKTCIESKHFRGRINTGLHLLSLPYFTKIQKGCDLNKITQQLFAEEKYIPRDFHS